MKALNTQVGIIGAGPAGLTLALMLHQAGISSIIIENKAIESKNLENKKDSKKEIKSVSKNQESKNKIQENKKETKVIESKKIVDKPIIYTIKKGDTLESIAKKNKVNIDKIKIDKNKKSNTLKIGDKIEINK